MLLRLKAWGVKPQASSSEGSSFRLQASSLKASSLQPQASASSFGLQPSSFRLPVLHASGLKSQASSLKPQAASFKSQACKLQAASFQLLASSYITSISNNLNIKIADIIATLLVLPAWGFRLQALGPKLQAASFKLQVFQTLNLKLSCVKH